MRQLAALQRLIGSDIYLSVSEVAELHGVTCGTVRGHIKSGKLESDQVQIGQKVYYRIPLEVATSYRFGRAPRVNN